MAVLDYDADGDLDLFVVRWADTPLLFRNEGTGQAGYLRLRLKGRAPATAALGARVRLTPATDAPVQLRELRAGSNFLGQDEPVLHFGLGPGNAPVAAVQIRWPDGSEQTFTDVPRNQLLEVSH
jgi:hypothetical protein